MEYGANQDNQSEFDFRNAVDQGRRRRIHRRRPKQAKDLVNLVITRRGIAAEQSTHQLQQVWDSIVGVDIANQTKTGSVRRGELEIIVANSSLMQLLSFQEKDYLTKINQNMRKAAIRKLRFRIGSIN
jgi:predicted nucleic acid-binding Zn ribbon protein